jgi:RHS repeat-associated protein
MRVEFGTLERCVSTSCGTHNEANWPDTPWDQQCTATPCTVGAPTFWSTRRLSSITTKVLNGTAYRTVETWTLGQNFPNPGDGTRAGLWLNRISHTGNVGTAVSLPDITFTGEQLPNRVDATDLSPAMNWWRIKNIVTESGGSIDVSYLSDTQTCVRGSRMPSAAHTNDLRCYPVRWQPPGATSPIIDYFHKYVVESVAETDLALPSALRSPRAITRYSYVGAPAWHYTDDDGLVEDKDKTWSVWRGYGRVKTVTGDAGEQTRKDAVYFRGMDGDHLPSGTREVNLPSAGGAPAAVDADALAGMVREELTYHALGDDDVASATVNEPWQSAPTASRTIDGVVVHARHVRIGAVRGRTVLDAGRGWRQTVSRTTFDSYGMPTQVDEAGDEAVTGDERCTLTAYARNTTAWLVSYPQRVRKYGVACSSVGSVTAADVISDVRTGYDQQAVGVAPTRGLTSRTEELGTWPSTYVTTERATHDSYGRVTESWDVRNNSTKTAFAPATGGPVTSTTSTNHLGWVTTTALEPAWGSAKSIVDPNARTTTLSYDGLGRMTAVWLPGRAASETASLRFAYLVRNNAPSAVTQQRLNPAGGYITSHTLYDAHLRVRQTQAPAAGTGGILVTDTLYDSSGRKVKENGPYVADGTPQKDMFATPADALVPAQTLTTYDGADRVTAEVLRVNGSERWRTTTAHGGDRTHVTPPAGGTPTTTIQDAWDNTVELRQYQAATPTGGYDATLYTYHRTGRLATVTDPAGNVRSSGYDLRGRNTTVDDPDKGLTTTTFNDAGDVLTVTDARNLTLAYTYDSLGRKTSLREGSATGTKRAEWTYDTVDASTTVRGQLVRSTRWVGTAAYVNAIGGFDAAYRPTSRTITIPVVATTQPDAGVAGSYSYVYGYHPDGSPSTVRLPALGGFAAEELTTEYDALGNPTVLRTNQGAGGAGTFLVNGTGYTRYGEVASIGRRFNDGPWLDTLRFYEEGTRRQVQRLTKRETEPSTVQDLRYTYDAIGNVTSAADVPTSGATDTQCFGYDRLRRLTEAWTPAGGDCQAGRSVAALGGPAPYWQSFTYDPTGNRLTSEDRSPTGTVSRTYTYPAAGADQPHTLRTVQTSGTGTASFTYDPTGNTLTRPGQTVTWDPEGRVASVTESGQATSFVYDADGVRLLRRTATGITLYLPDGQELSVNNAGGKAATRYYTHAGETIGLRDGTGVTWLASDHQGTALVSVPSGTQVATVRRQKPFGEPRGTTVVWPGERGFVGGTLDSTGTTHLGAREYDPQLGRFLSVDPVVDVNAPQQMHGYSYSDGSPVTMSDPDGLYREEGERRSSCTGSCATYSQHYTQQYRARQPRWEPRDDYLSSSRIHTRKLRPYAAAAKDEADFVLSTATGLADVESKLRSDMNNKQLSDFRRQQARKAYNALRRSNTDEWLKYLRQPWVKRTGRGLLVAGWLLTVVDYYGQGESWGSALLKGTVVTGFAVLGGAVGAAVGGAFLGPVGAFGGGAAGGYGGAKFGEMFVEDRPPFPVNNNPNLQWTGP